MDLQQVRSSLAALPQVEDVQVQRQLPDIVSIEVQERRPIAWLEYPEAGIVPHTSDGGWMVDASGNLFPCESLVEEHMSLPIIASNDLPALVGKAKAGEGEIASAIQLIVLNSERLYHDQIEIERIDCARDYSMIVQYRNDASVVFASEGIDKQLDEFAAVLAYAEEKSLQIATLNLMVKENKPITFYDTPTGWNEDAIVGGEKPRARAADVRGILGSLY